jgi:hypothetical protein
MTFATRNASSWPNRLRAAAKRYEDPGLSALMAAQLILIFVAEPLAFEGFELPLVAMGIIVAGLILLLTVGSNQRGALIIVGAAGAVRLITAAADLIWGAPVQTAEGISAVLALLAMMWAVFEIVFSPGRVTAHRVRGAIALYLGIAIIFAWLYRLTTGVVPAAFSGLKYVPGQHGALSPFLYYSMTSLTTLGLGDITPVNEFARSLTVLEALLGQIFPAVILARILTLYADDRSGQPSPQSPSD